MTDLSRTIAPKSDQLNADDLIAGPRTITITRVSAAPASSEQPIDVFFEGDNGKPWKPCKSMRRVLVAAWKADGSKYAGRRLTLYRDPKVKFGGLEVGGIRISHMSHIEDELVLALTETRASRKPFRVKPLRDEAPRREPEGRPSEPPRQGQATAPQAGGLAGKMIGAIRGAEDSEALSQILEDDRFKRDYQRLGPDDAEKVDLEADNRRAELTTKIDAPPGFEDVLDGDEGGYGAGSDLAGEGR